MNIFNKSIKKVLFPLILLAIVFFGVTYVNYALADIYNPTDVSSSGGASLTGNNTFTGQNIFSSITPTQIKNLDTVLYADQFSGADLCAQTNAAYAALPSTGGRIMEPSGSFNCTTPIVFGTNNKIVDMYCPSGGGASNNAVGGTTITYTPTTGDAITVNTNNYVVAGSKIENCNVQGTNGTTARTSRGIVLGGTNGAFSFTLDSVNLNGFGKGLDLYQNTSFITVWNSTIHFNGQNIFIESTAGANGENFRMIGGVVADSNNQAGGAIESFCIRNQLSGNTQVSFIGTSIDDCSYYSDQFGGTANISNFTDVHWENPNGDAYPYIQTLSNTPATEINVIGGDMMNDRVTGMNEYVQNGGDITFTGTTIDSNNNVTVPVTRLVTNSNATNVDTVSWKGLTSNGKGSTYIYGTVPFSPEGYGTGLGTTFYVQSSTQTRIGGVGIGNISTPTAELELGGGQATPQTAPLKIDSGTLLSVTEGGAIENNGSHLFYTAANSGTRFQLDQQSGTSPSIGGTLTSATAGSVLFAGSGTFAQDNANFFWDSTNHWLGLGGTTVPTNTITLASGSNGIGAYNTSDQVTNFEKATMSWASNVFTIATSNGGTGTLRNLALTAGANTNVLVRNATDLIGHFALNPTFSGTTSGAQFGIAGTWTNSAGIGYGISIVPTTNQTSTAGWTGVYESIFDSGSGNGVKNLIDLGTDTASNGTGTHTSRFKVSSTGNTTIGGGIYLPSTTLTSTTNTIVNTAFTVRCDSTTGAQTDTLPTAASSTGLVLNFKKIDSSGNSCTLKGNGAETIDGSNTKVTSTQYVNFQVQSNGTTWDVL